MKILILTQKVDKNDPVLGFFHRWLEEFAKNFELVTVICLGKGEYQLPENVEVLSLGKENGSSRLGYLFNFYKYIWEKRAQYSHIFVHMNQEYVLLGGILWRLMGKKVFLWRNHAKGSVLTHLAAILSHKVFYTSPKSYTARFKNAVQMPVGVDIDFFKPDPNIQRMPNSILLLGRISPVKKVLELIDWVKDKGYHATIAGPILDADKVYGQLVKRRIKNHESRIKYIGPVTQSEALKLYQTHEIYANFTPAGSMDKAVIEAALCGMKLEVRNPDLKNFRAEDHSLTKLMEKLKLYI